ncbi:MAG: hypothetical protein OQJ95_10200 [Kangiella sp.]|jgi:hypothetical protein|nr:hypothetical protein [Kangiella sp.]MCW9028004.1 hypothetical protein [Kangiella sp.]
MGTMIKVVIGVIIGFVGYWALDRYVLNNDLVAEQSLEINQEVMQSEVEVSHSDKSKKTEKRESPEQVKIETLTIELDSLKQQMEIKNQELLAIRTENKRLNGILGGSVESVSGMKDNYSQTDKTLSNHNKFEGIPESHHTLLSRPESTPKATYELHDELVGEKEDISWATEKEQQINHFLMNYKDSAQYIIHTVDCRSSLCEIIGTEHPSERDIWSEVTGQMRNQAWWEFRGTHTTSSTDSNGNLLFVTILQRSQASEKAN